MALNVAVPKCRDELRGALEVSFGSLEPRVNASVFVGVGVKTTIQVRHALRKHGNSILLTQHDDNNHDHYHNKGSYDSGGFRSGRA